jgi:hypothetical protein
MKDDEKNDYDLFKSLENLSKQLSDEGYSLTSEELDDLKDQIDYFQHNNKRLKDFEANAENISRYISEYLETFIILGYDLEGNRIVFQHHGDSTLKQDALFKLLEQTFIKLVQKSRNLEE